RTTNMPIFEERHITITAPLRSSNKGLETTFNLSASNIFNTTNQVIESIQIDFNDDYGLRNVTLNKNMVVNYTDAGKKTITFILTLDNGDVVTRQASMDIKYSNVDVYTNSNRIITTFNSSI